MIRPNQFVKHPDQLRPAVSFGDRFARSIEPIFGSMRAFYFLIVWQMAWIVLATAGIGFFGHDKYPFVFLLFLSNLYQLWALPILGYLTKKADAKRDAKANADHEALTHIANVVEMIAAERGINLAEEIS